MISIPKKTTDEVDWTTPIRNVIAQSYGESPDNYAAECAALQRCRQDAVRGAGSDMTARAARAPVLVQTSIAYEKASIIFQIAATHSAIASSQNRSDPEGLKRAFHYFRTCTGMLTYINDNFLHAPSTDLSRDVIKFLVNTILAQATEVFFEKCRDEKKGNALVSKIAAQAAYMYTSLSEEVKEFMGKGIFDRNWVTLIQIKAKYFTSLSHHFRGLADHAAGKHGDALVRFTVSESAAKEAQRIASTFDSIFVTQMSPTLPSDAGPSIRDLTKAHLAMCADRKAEAQRDNDLIYNAVLPTAETLPAIDKTAVATPIPIQDVYSTPDVQKVIGPDLFIKLIPLSVHESASVYSEEKAKLVRAEVENAESAEVEVTSGLEALGVKEGLVRYRAIVEGGVGGEEEVPVEVRRWREDIGLMEEREPVEGLMADLNRLKDAVGRDLETTSRDLEIESKDCEMMRVKYEHLWTQAPSASLTKTLRQDLKSHFEALHAAAASDQQVVTLWDAVRNDILLLLSPEVEDVFRASTERGAGGPDNLLDLDIGSEANDADERAKVAQFVEEIDERLGRLNKISRERKEVLKDLKEKIQSDDVSHLLLVNRRNAGVEPTLFAAELEKFRPYQQRLAATTHHQQMMMQEITMLWKGLKDLAGRGPGARKWEEREKRKKDTVKRFSRARDVYMEVRDGLAKGLQFYRELTELTSTLKGNVSGFVTSRTAERETLAGQLEAQKRLSSTAVPSPAPPLADKPRRPPPPPSSSIDASFASMNIGGPTSPPAMPPPRGPWNGNTNPRPPSQYSYNGGQRPSSSQYSTPPQPSGSSSYPPPPPAPPSSPPSSQQPSYRSPDQDPYAALGAFSSQFSTSSQAPSGYSSQPYQQQQQPQSYSSPSQPYASAPPPQQQQGGYPPQQPPPPSYYAPPSQPYQYQQPPVSSPASSLPPPPPPVSYQSQPYATSSPYQNVSPPPQPGYGQYPQSYGR